MLSNVYRLLVASSQLTFEEKYCAEFSMACGRQILPQNEMKTHGFYLPWEALENFAIRVPSWRKQSDFLKRSTEFQSNYWLFHCCYQKTW